MRPDGENEWQLVERTLGGDTYAFDTLVAPYRRRLHSHILQIVKDPSDAEDLLQDTLIRIYRGLRNYRGDASFYTWTFRIAVNCAITFVAHRRRHLEEPMPNDVVSAYGTSERAPVCDDPETIVSGMQMVETVGAALDSMCPEFKTAILLREFDGMSYHEIADAMVCPVGTVRSRISSARQAIARHLQQQGYLFTSRGP
jgi:RNA polymerase sigma-70 factor (ECF subfamily)